MCACVCVCVCVFCLQSQWHNLCLCVSQIDINFKKERKNSTKFENWIFKIEFKAQQAALIPSNDELDLSQKHQTHFIKLCVPDRGLEQLISPQQEM